jgi:hypothetical protein
MLVETLAAKGVTVTLSGDNIAVKTKAPLTDGQRAFLRERKAQLTDELRQAVPAKARQALTAVITEFVDDCMRWYGDDLSDIAAMDRPDLKAAVADYLGRADWYNRGLIEEPAPHEPIMLTANEEAVQ